MTPKGTLPANFTVEYSKAVLESLVEQGNNWINEPDVFHLVAHEMTMRALVEVAKAMLRVWEHFNTTKTIRNGEDITAWERQSGMMMLIKSAEAVAPQMLEAGMTLPDATNR